MNWQQQGQELSNYNPRGSGGYCRQMQTSFPALPSGCGGEKKANHGDVHGSIDCSSNGWPDLANIRYPVPGAAKFEETSITNVRRERISQRMKYLQDLVPGCSKITGKAGMLDEIINYVQSLQRQVEVLENYYHMSSP
ncbi:hypothetical protein BHE74_00010189 [Ensete ventricosum]|nr:hypothetical protein BHE74_00010189 [Ensete ventricosum]